MKTIIYYLIAFLLISFLTLTSALGEVFFYHTDNFGTPMAMTDMSGEVVWRADELPFGEEYETIENPIQNNRRFLGKELDESTGLICMGSRYLDPDTGRFTQPDPLRLVDPATGKINQEMLLNPQRQNRYVYGLNNPYKYVDPDGNYAVTTAFDVYSFQEGYKSYLNNISQRKFLSAAVDTLGIVVDSVSVALPGVYIGAGLAIKTSRGIKKTENVLASPALKNNPYSPGEVSKRQSQLRESLGVNLSPDTPIPTQKPGSNIKSGVHVSEGKARHSSGERNVSSKEEHSRVAKSRGGRGTR